MSELAIGCGLGFLLGLRHALEPDHLAAISTLVTERPGVRRAAGIGAAWGLGHTAALFLVGVVLFFARAQMPPRLADLFELLVAFVLILLGARAIHAAVVPVAPVPPVTGVAHGEHTHGAIGHRHGGMPAHFHAGRFAIAGRPFVVGVCHGLAGSGALTAVALAHMPTVSGALGYVVVFGCGSLAGMSLLSVLAGWQLSLLARVAHTDRARRTMGAAAGSFACVLGVIWGWPMIARLFPGAG